MRIDQISIQNFKGFASENFRLNPRFTVFIGDNAKGKTSALDALAVAAGSFLRGIDVVKHEARSIAKNEILISTIDGDPKPQLPSKITASGEFSGQAVEWSCQVDEVTKRTTTKHKGAARLERMAANLLALSRKTSGITFPVLAYHGTGRLWAEHEAKKTRYRTQSEGVEMAYCNCLSPKSSGKEFLSWFKTYEDEVRKFEQPHEIILLDAFKKAIISIIPDEQWQDMAFSFKDNDLIGIFTTEAGKKERLLFQQLSDGYRNAMGMAADIAYRSIKLNPHLGKDVIEKTPGIVLIDEIDLHLHPNWQRRIVDDLRRTFPSIQFIATTHSPFIIQSLDSSELINLDMISDVKPKELTIEEVSQDIMGVESVFARENEQAEAQAIHYLDIVAQSSPTTSEQDQKLLDEIETRISDPAVRAFLKMKRLENKSK